MRSVRVLAIAAGLLLACAASPAFAGSSTPAPDSAWTADTALLRTPAIETETAADPGLSVSDAAPSPTEIVTMRERVNRRAVRVFLSRDAYDVGCARVDTLGVAFSPPNLHGVPAWDNGGPNGDYSRPAPLASPIGWHRIDRIALRRPCGLRGALVGAVFGAVACTAILGWASNNGVDVGLGALVVLAYPPIGALLGGAVGSMNTRLECVWQRAGVDPGSAGPGTGATGPSPR